MARQATGQVVEHDRRGGRTFALRFRAHGRRHYRTLGTAAEGWTQERAELELANVLADVRRGIWRPPVTTEVEAPEEATFHEFASEWLVGRSRELSEGTVLDYTWQLSNHLLPYFAEHKLSAITVEEVDRYRTAKVAAGKLSATSINKTITRLAQILELAEEYGLIDRNPARGRRRKVRSRRPKRTYLDRAEQVEALIAGAAKLDAEARADRRSTSRRALLSVLVFAGLRIGEALKLRWGDVDLASGRLTVKRSKTEAGERMVVLWPVLRDDLAVAKAASRDVAAKALVFPTSTGKPLGATNVRRRILAKAVEKADAKLEEDGCASLPERLTPHSLRRTFASIALAIGEPVPQVRRSSGTQTRR